MVKTLQWLLLNDVLFVWLHFGSFSLFTLALQMLMLNLVKELNVHL